MRSVPPPTKVPTFRELDRVECDAILERNTLGRIAFSFHDRVDIEPIHYVHHGEWLYARTAPGAKIATIAHNRWVAFEVDEMDSTFNWRSVVVRGSVHVLDPDGAPAERRDYAEAVKLMRTIVPETFTSSDPVAFRFLLIRVHVDEVTGRAATTSDRGASAGR
jgi:nitroimidazol reductase NimA-like FMN-containing flavoprotein (pyridoxamine 5'-phosphate oxidase superfamily)